jgi:hypothetical protein
VSSRADIDDLPVVGLPGAVGAIAFGDVLHDLTSHLKAEADRMVKRLGAATNAKLRAQLDQEQSWQVPMWPYRLGAHLLRQHHEAAWVVPASAAAPGGLALGVAGQDGGGQRRGRGRGGSGAYEGSVRGCGRTGGILADADHKTSPGPARPGRSRPGPSGGWRVAQERDPKGQ